MFWVDPPQGYLYGFPAIWDEKEFPELTDFLRLKKVPESIISLGHVRFWEATKEEIEKYNNSKKD